MATTKYAPMFQVVSGALTKINKKSPHAADQKMVLTTHRVAPTTSKNCSRVYLRDLSSITRTTPVKASEIQQRQRFAAICTAVATRLQDPSKMAADQADFKAQLGTAGAKTTLRSYLWSLEAAAYDANH